MYNNQLAVVAAVNGDDVSSNVIASAAAFERSFFLTKTTKQHRTRELSPITFQPARGPVEYGTTDARVFFVRDL
jgi:hypothetical protein